MPARPHLPVAICTTLVGMSHQRTPSERRALVAAFHRSGLAQAAFSRTVPVCATTLRAYLREDAALPTVLPARVVVDTAPEPGLVELDAGDVRVRAPVGTDVAYLASLLAAVRRC